MEESLLISADNVQVVVDSSQGDGAFPTPPSWTSQSYIIEPLKFEQHKPFHSTNQSEITTAPSILTFPDIGQGESSLSPFFQYCRRSKTCWQIDVAQAHYHTCFPGHEINAPNLFPQVDTSLPAIVRAITTLIERYQISRLVGFGVGFGAVVLLRAAAQMSTKFAGLVMVSPVISPSPISERFHQITDGLVSRQLGLGLTRRTKDRFLARWLSDQTIEQHSGPGQALEEELDRRNAHNVLHMLAEDTWREDSSKIINQVTTRILLITGKASTLRYHVEDSIGYFDPKNTSRLDVPDVGSLVHCEDADRVARSLSLFLQGIPGFS